MGKSSSEGARWRRSWRDRAAEAHARAPPHRRSAGGLRPRCHRRLWSRRGRMPRRTAAGSLIGIAVRVPASAGSCVMRALLWMARWMESCRQGRRTDRPDADAGSRRSGAGAATFHLVGGHLVADPDSPRMLERSVGPEPQGRHALAVDRALSCARSPAPRPRAPRTSARRQGCALRAPSRRAAARRWGLACRIDRGSTPGSGSPFGSHQ